MLTCSFSMRYSLWERTNSSDTTTSRYYLAGLLVFDLKMLSWWAYFFPKPPFAPFFSISIWLFFSCGSSNLALTPERWGDELFELATRSKGDGSRTGVVGDVGLATGLLTLALLGSLWDHMAIILY